MTGELRCRTLPDTLELARGLAGPAGVTRISDVTGFAVPGIPVFQATRPQARSLTVTQGKGISPTAAIVAALLEAVELWSAENLAQPETKSPLSELAQSDIATWSGSRDDLAINLDPRWIRGWLTGRDVASGRECAVPWDLLSLDYTRDTLEYPATSMGLACGNNRIEALVSGLAEILEHHGAALFDRLSPRERLAGQIVLETIGDPTIGLLLRKIAAAGFQVKAWSMATEAGYAAIRCGLFRAEQCFDELAPAAGSGCHPDARVAFARALLEAVQTQAGLVAGARDDLTAADYGSGGERAAALMFGSLAFGHGTLDWSSVPSVDCYSSEQCLELLLTKAQQLTNLPIVAFEHVLPQRGLSLAHVFAPGLMAPGRRSKRKEPPEAMALVPRRTHLGRRKVLFGGPSIVGLAIPDGIEVRPPAECGDLAGLLDDLPAAVALVDGHFRIAPTVWHKEILDLIARGTRVIGGSSLGALRAAEMERFGMVGIGAIFHAYRAGVIVRDDAVMLVHAPVQIGYAPLSVPLVDAEYALSLTALPAPALRMMQRIIRRAPFDTRTWRACREEYRVRTGKDFPVSEEALAAVPSLKQMDAELVIAALADGVTGVTGRRPAPPLTSHYRALLARTARAFAPTPV